MVSLVFRHRAQVFENSKWLPRLDETPATVADGAEWNRPIAVPVAAPILTYQVGAGKRAERSSPNEELLP